MQNFEDYLKFVGYNFTQSLLDSSYALLRSAIDRGLFFFF